MHINFFQVKELVDCGTLKNPEHGEVYLSEGTKEGATAYYGCDSDMCIGTCQRSCQSNGKWTGSDPTCEDPGSFYLISI